MHENRETSETPAGKPDGRSAGEGSGRTARVYVCEESHSGVLPMNHSNKDTRLSAESGEGRPLIKENAGQSNTYPTQSGKGVSQGLAGVRKAAREHKEMKFTALLHHLTVDLLRESFYSLKGKLTRGVQGVTWQDMRPAWRIGSWTFTDGSIVEQIERCPRGECTYRKKMGGNVIGGCGSGRQDRPTGRGHHPQPDL